MNNTPAVKLDTVHPRKCLFKLLNIPWEKRFEKWETFRDKCRKYVEARKGPGQEYEWVNKGWAYNPWTYLFQGSTSCGTQQLSELKERDALYVAKAMVWAVWNMAPNFIYWGGDENYKDVFALLDELGATYVMRIWNTVHNHYVREYHLAYDVADDTPMSKVDNPNRDDNRAYDGYRALYPTRSKPIEFIGEAMKLEADYKAEMAKKEAAYKAVMAARRD